MRFRPGQHLRRQSDIRAVREQGSRTDCRAFTIWCRKRSEADSIPPALPAALPRVGVVASTAAVGAAVLRNRAKRRLREIFRLNQHLLPPDCDLLLIARAAVTRWAFPELEKKFIEACQRIAAPAKNA
jgi:ribonuclease P protein component